MRALGLGADRLFECAGRPYRTEPQAGAEAIAILMRYAIPQLRNATGRLRDEVALVRAYLELHRIRMGSRLAFTVQADPALLDQLRRQLARCAE